MSQTSEPAWPLLDVTDKVQEFYDRYPYRAPVESLDQYRRAWADRRKRRADYHRQCSASTISLG